MKRQSGLVTLIYIFIVALVATLILIIGQSRLLLALSRNKSASDSLITSYRAEYEINNFLIQFANGTLNASDFNRFPITKSLGDGFSIKAEGEIDGNEQILTVTAKRAFAVSKIKAVRAVADAGEITPVDMTLMIDCTGSMNSKDTGQTTTRIQEAKKAALSFVNQIASHPNGDFIRMGLGVFSEEAAWLRTSGGVDITPDNNVSFSQITQAINSQFNTTREDSPACRRIAEASTSIGSGYVFAHDYFAQSSTTHKKVEVLITDGVPNSRILYPACPPSVACSGTCEREAQDFLRCALTEKTKKWDAFNFGVRDPSITAFGVTIISPSAPLVEDIFVDTIGAGNYFNITRSNQLSGILDIIFDKVISTVSSITISRVIPVAEE